MIIFHVVKANEWLNCEERKVYEEKARNSDEFLHCCTFEQIPHVAKNNLKNISENLLIVCINTEYLTSELKWEENHKNKMVFPHLYGPINEEAIISTVKFEKGKDGEFFISDELSRYQNIEKSCGAIVIHKFESIYKALLIGFFHNEKINWGFPKGHVEKNENEYQTAKREIKEETGLDVDLIPDFRKNTYFSCKKGVTQQVVYFGAISGSKEVICQEGEVEQYLWCNLGDVCNHLTFQCDKDIFNSFVKYMNF